MPGYKRPEYERIPPIGKKPKEARKGKGVVDIETAILNAIELAEKKGKRPVANDLRTFLTNFRKGKKSVMEAQKALEEARKHLELPNGGVVERENIEIAIKNHFSNLPPEHLKALIKTLTSDPENLKKALRYLKQVGEFKPRTTS